MEQFIYAVTDRKVYDIKQLKDIKQFYDEHPELNIHDDHEYVFRKCCELGELETAKLLFEMSQNEKVGLINIHEYSDMAFRDSCKYGHLEVAKWLLEISQKYELGKINIHAQNECALLMSCFHGYPSITKWIYFLDRGNYDVEHINSLLGRMQDDKPFLRTIGYDYRNNNGLDYEYTIEYNKWKASLKARKDWLHYKRKKSYKRRGF